jgi:hypothetical protein
MKITMFLEVMFVWYVTKVQHIQRNMLLPPSGCYHLPSKRQNYPLPTAARRGFIEINCKVFENFDSESSLVVFIETSQTFSNK